MKMYQSRILTVHRVKVSVKYLKKLRSASGKSLSSTQPISISLSLRSIRPILLLCTSFFFLGGGGGEGWRWRALRFEAGRLSTFPSYLQGGRLFEVGR